MVAGVAAANEHWRCNIIMPMLMKLHALNGSTVITRFTYIESPYKKGKERKDIIIYRKFLVENNLKKMASVETKTEAVINDEENEDAENGDEVTDDGKAVVAKKSKKKKKPKKPSKLKECAL